MIDFLHLPKPQNGYVDYFPGFSSSSGGQWQVWNKPRGINFVRITAIGGGGGGGGGSTSVNSSRNGGSAGCNAGIVNLMMPAIFLPDRLYVSSGLGGSGGIAGANGSSGISSYVSIAPSNGTLYCICNPSGGLGGFSSGLQQTLQSATSISAMLQSGQGNMTSFVPHTATVATCPGGGRGSIAGTGQSVIFPTSVLSHGAGGGGGFGYAGGSILPQKSATITLSSIANSILGAASLTASTTPTEGNTDDGYWELALPWTVSYNGTDYSKVYVSTNSHLTFDLGSIVRSSISANTPPCDKIFIQTADNSCQRIYYGTEGVAPNRTYRIVYEGTNNISGTLGSPTMVWEATFYEATPGQIDIQLGTMARSGGVNGVYSGSELLNSGSAVSWGTANTGVRIVSTNPKDNLLFSGVPGGAAGTSGSKTGQDGGGGINNMELLLFSGGSGGGSGFDGTASVGGRGGDGGFGCGGGGGGGGTTGGRGGNGGNGLVIISCW